MSKPKNPDKHARQKRAKPTTTKAVQRAENTPPPADLPSVTLPEPEDEDDGVPWGTDGLTVKQRLFCRYYLAEAGGNGAKAARLAGYRDDNSHAIRAAASRLLTKANIQRALEREFARRFGSPDDVRASIAAIANANAADYLSPDAKTGKLALDLDKLAAAGALGLVHEWREEGFDAGDGVTIVKRRIKLYDKLKALEILAKLNGQLVERHHVTATVHNVAPLMGGVLADPEAFAAAKLLRDRLATIRRLDGDDDQGSPVTNN